MKRKIKWLILPALVIFSSCQIFLGQEPDANPSEVLKSLWNDFNDIHANLDFRMSGNLNYNSWYDVYHNSLNGYALKINPNMSEESLFEVCSNMLRELNDVHVGLYSPDFEPRIYYSGSNEHFNIDKVRNYLNGDGNAGYKNFVFGTFSSNPDIGYIYIKEFINEDPKTAIDNIINSLTNTKALVLDVRNNRGGDMYVMEYNAAHFTSEIQDYCKLIIKNGPKQNDFSAPVICTVKSINKAFDGGYGYTKPIVLLTNKNTISMAEWFTLALRTQSHVTHIGTATCGALSPRMERFMINGWVYSISPGRVTDMNGKNYEVIGISPDKEERNTTDVKDEQLEEAVKIASGEEEVGLLPERPPNVVSAH